MTYDPGYAGQPPPRPLPPISGPPVSPSNWPPMVAPGYPVVTPMMPRPTVVSLAVVLTFVGVALAFVASLLSHLALSNLALLDLPKEAQDSLEVASGMSTFITAGVNLVAAAGASICAIFAMRGSNGARVTLCVLCGMFAGWKLMCGGYSLAIYSENTMNQVLAQLGDGVRFAYGAVAADFLLMLLAIVILILLVTAPANRYFGSARAVSPAMPY